VLAFTAASLVLGKEAGQGRVTQGIESTVGHTVAVAIQATARYTYQSGSGVPATVLSIVFFGFGATGLSSNCKAHSRDLGSDAPDPGAELRGFCAIGSDRSWTVLGISALLLPNCACHGSPWLPWPDPAARPASRIFPLWRAVTLSSCLGHHTLRWPSADGLLAFCPTPKIRSLAATFGSGAGVSALLFLLGNHTWIGWYLAATSVTSVYGSSRSIVIVLCGSTILHRSCCSARSSHGSTPKHRGSLLEPQENAVRVSRKGHD